MAYNVLRCAYDAGVRRAIVATSNHAADWYEHNLIHTRKMDVVHPYDFPLSDNFYGWAKSSQEVMGFLFACGFPSFEHPSGTRNSRRGRQRGTQVGGRHGPHRPPA